jgi:ribonuclease BN (tRNA processing enzyme)
MDLTILGSGTAVPSLRRGAPGYLVRAGGDLLVLDTGPGTMSRLLKQGVAHENVTHLLYSHNHLDHSGELAPWLFASRIPASSRVNPLTIIGSAAFLTMLDSLREIYGHWIDPATYNLDRIEMDGAARRRAAFSGWEVTVSPVNHIESSLAYRITSAQGRSLVYSGDTDVSDDLVELARGADLLLIEASSPDGRKIESHLTPSLAGEIASRAGVRKVVLTHFYPACDGVDMLAQLHRTYQGEAALAEDGMRLTV